MNWERVNQVLQIVANLGVVLGLVLVAAQMRQTAEAIALDNQYAVADKLGELEQAAIGDDFFATNAMANRRPADLTETQAMQYWAYVDAVLNLAYRTWVARGAGRATEAAWVDAKVSVSGMLGTDAAQVVWKHYRAQFPPSFVAEIDAEFAEHGNATTQAFDAIVADLRRLPSRGG